MIKILISIISILLSYGYGITIYEHTEINFNAPQTRFFFTGFILFLPFWFFWLKKSSFYSTFEHELTHLIVGLFFFKKPAHFTVTHEEGGVTGLFGNNFIITLAPYFLPTFALFILPIYPIINSEFQLYFFILFGFIISYHVLSTIQEFSFYQPDIYTSGKLFSTIFLIFANIIVYGFILMFVNGGFGKGWMFLKQGIIETMNLLTYFKEYFL